MSRNGKIARLPHEVRERLENGGKTCAELTDEAGRAIFGETWDKDDCAPGGAKQGTAHEIHEIHEMKKTAAGTGVSPPAYAEASAGRQSTVASPQSAKGSQEAGPGTGNQGTAHETTEIHEMKKTAADTGVSPPAYAEASASAKATADRSAGRQSTVPSPEQAA